MPERSVGTLSSVEDFVADHRLTMPGGDLGTLWSVLSGILWCQPLVTDALQSCLEVEAIFGAAEFGGSSFAAALGSSELLDSAGLVSHEV